MSNVIIDDLPEESEKHCLSSIKMNVTIRQNGRHPHERTFDADFVTSLPKECGNIEEICTDTLLVMALQKEAS